MTPEGLTCFPSDRAPKATADAVAAAIAEHGMTLFARVDHAAGARIGAG